MFGDNLRRYRIEKGFSQSDVADKLFVTRQCVSKWEKGVTQPDLQTLKQIGELLGVSVDLLISDDEIEQGGNKRISASANAYLFVANVLVAVFCIIAFVVVFRFAPKIIPAHWTHSVIDRYGSRNEILINMISPVIFLAVDTIVFIVLRRGGDGNKPAIIAHVTMIVLQVACVIFIVATYARYLTALSSFITCLTVDLMACLSVAMHPKICRKNYLFGLRTAETLNSEFVWNKSNAFACYLFCGGSAVIFAVNMIWAFKLPYLFLLSYIVLTAVVVIYSKILYKSKKQESKE